MQRKIAVSLLQAVSLLVLLTSDLRASDPLDTWAWRNPLPNGSTMRAVTYAGGLIVGVGDWGTIMTSTNLTTDWWVQSPMGINTSTLRAIAHGNNTFVVAASDSPDGDKTKRFFTSTDGTNWSVQTWGNANTRGVYGLAYGAGLFVAVTERSGVWSSPNGTNWTQRIVDSSSSSHLYGITFAPDFGFVAVGSAGKVLTSPDGIAWGTNTATTVTLNAVTWGYVTNSDETVTTNFLAVGNSGTALTSPDGTNWTSHDSLVVSELNAAAFAPGVGYIAAGVGAVVQYSTDGTNWNSSYSDISNPVNVPGNDFRGAAYAADLGYFVAVGLAGEVETSPTGAPATWTAAFRGRPENLTGVARGNVNFVAVGNVLPYPPNNAVILTSRSGSGWRVRTANTTLKLNNITYGADTFVAVGNSGAIVTSVDEGTNWSAQTSGVVANLSGVSYLTNSVTNVFLATGASGTLLTSPDGTNWTAQTSGVTITLYGSAYGGSAYVVVGAGGAILTSPDCTTWTPVTSGTTRDINGIIYNAANSPNNFIAVGAYGGIRTSPDGTTWTARTTSFGTGSGVTFYSIAYGGGRFVVGGNTAPGLQVSTDGVAWTAQYSPSSSGMKAIAYAPNTFVGAGNGGTIVQAGALLGPQIQYTYAGGTLTLTWPGGGTLQASSPDVTGTYTNVPGASSPWPITPLSEPSMYFRVQQP